MHRVLKLTNEVVLAFFLFAIIGIATITTIGLSPVAKNGAQTIISNSASPEAVLGSNTVAGLNLSQADFADSGKLDFKNGHYVYSDTLRAPLQAGLYKKSFVIAENSSASELKLALELKLPEAYQDQLVVNILDPKGNSYDLSDKRELKLLPQSRQVYQLTIGLKNTVNFDIPFEVWLSSY